MGNTRDQLSSSPSPTKTNGGGVRYLSGVGTMGENQIGEWLRRGGDEALQNKGKSLDTEANRHRYAATSFGVGADYIQSKIMADNNIKPPSVERRIALDKRWAKLKVEIRKAYYKEFSSQPPPSAMEADEFCDNESTRELFGAAIEELNRGAKRVNDAIIKRLASIQWPIPCSARPTVPL